MPARARRNSLSIANGSIDLLNALGEAGGEVTLDELFGQMDKDSSGTISREELMQAMKRMYGKPLDASAIDKMMAEGDKDDDGEISLPEFKILMMACEKRKDANKKLERTMGLWYSIRDRGLMPSREQKSSEDMKKRRRHNEAKRLAKLESALADAALRYPQDLPPPPPPGPVPLPAGGGHPPTAQAQLKDSPAYKKRLEEQRRKRKAADLEAGLRMDALDTSDELGCFARWWQSLPTPGEFTAQLFDFLDTYFPIFALLALPMSLLIKSVDREVRAMMVEPGTVAPPPPPASPDWVAAAQNSFYELAQENPGAYLGLDLGLAFAIGALAFFWKDIEAWFEAQRLANNYQKLDGEDAEEDHMPAMSAKEMRVELYKAINIIEEVCANLTPSPILSSVGPGPAPAPFPPCASPCDRDRTDARTHARAAAGD